MYVGVHRDMVLFTIAINKHNVGCLPPHTLYRQQLLQRLGRFTPMVLQKMRRQRLDQIDTRVGGAPQP